MKQVVCYILIMIASFVWLISGGLLMFQMMSVGPVEDMYSAIAESVIPVMDYHIKGTNLMLIFVGSLMLIIGLNVYIRKLNEKEMVGM